MTQCFWRTLICSTLNFDRVSSCAESELDHQFPELYLPYLVALEESCSLLGKNLTYPESHAYHEQKNMTQCTVIALGWLPKPWSHRVVTCLVCWPHEARITQLCNELREGFVERKMLQNCGAEYFLNRFLIVTCRYEDLKDVDLPERVVHWK